MPSPLSWSLLPTVTAGSIDNTARDIINDAALELGLSSSAVEDPFASASPLYLQMCALLKKAGTKLWRQHLWSQLLDVYSFTTVLNQGEYDLPDNFGRPIQCTIWNSAQTRPMNSITPQSWREYRARNLSSVESLDFRVKGYQIQLLTEASTPADQTIVFEYISRFWVQTEGATAPDKEVPEAATDVVWFDPDLVIALLKWEWAKAKAMPTKEDFREDFEEILALSIETNQFNPPVNLTGITYGSIRRIDGENLPELIG
jgi:hypothetical protein